MFVYKCEMTNVNHLMSNLLMINIQYQKNPMTLPTWEHLLLM